LLFASAVCCVSCAAPLVKLPSGPGAPAPDAADALAEATAACRAVSTLSAEVAVSGSVGGRRLRGRLLVGVAPPASARIEAVAPAGQPIFIFVATGDEATLLLPRDNRVLPRGNPAAVLEAVAGPPLDAVQLRETLTGCAAATGGDSSHQGRQIGDDWRVVPHGSIDLYLHRVAGHWQLVAAVHRNSGDATTWRAEYGRFESGSPRALRLASADGKRFDLRLELSQVDTKAQLGPDVFRVQIPRDADPITLDELKRSGPLGPSK
jgi:outer membrane lipoprotein-sorting protein